MKVADLSPASSPGEASFISTLKPRRSAQRRYIRSSISAQSWESVPPAPALMVTTASPASYAAGEEPLLLELGEPPLHGGDLVGQLGGHLLVLGGELGVFLEIADVDHELAEVLQPLLRAGMSSGDLGRRCLIVPEAWLLHLPLEPIDLSFQRIWVKGNPRAASAAPGSRRGALRFPPWEVSLPSV